MYTAQRPRLLSPLCSERQTLFSCAARRLRVVRLELRAESSRVSQTGFIMLSHSGSPAWDHMVLMSPGGITCLWKIHCDLQRQEKCRVHQLNMCAFVNSAQSWDVGIFKWVNNVARLYLCAVYKSLNAHYRLFRVASWLALSRRFLPSLKYFFFYIQCIFLLARYQTSFPCRKIYMH